MDAATARAMLEQRRQAILDSIKRATEEGADAASQKYEDAQAEMDAARQTAGTLVDDARETAEGVRDKVYEAGKVIYENVTGAVEDVADAIHQEMLELWDKTQEGLKVIADNGRDLVADIRRIQSDPVGVAKELYAGIQPGVPHDPSKPHFEAPEGKMLRDHADWVCGTKFPEEIFYFCNVPKSYVKSMAPPGESHLSDEELSFIYLDVGQWGGGPGLPQRRDFGIIYGRTVALCEFGRGRGSTGSPTVEGCPAGGDSPAAEAYVINELLETLVDAHIVQLLVSTEKRVPELDAPDTIYIFVGDMHIPVLREDGREEAEKYVVEQMGRFQIDDAVYRIWKESPLYPASNLGAFERAVGLDGLGVSPASYVGTVPGVAWDAKAWLDKYYRADDFAEAAADLKTFVERLEGYVTDCASDIEKPGVKLVQTGDMFDLWVGMLCHYDGKFKTGGPTPMKLEPRWQWPSAQEFVSYWTLNALLTSNYDAIQRFLGFVGDKAFLYGNHDNYYAPSAYPPPELYELSGKQHRQENFIQKSLIFAEHGHQGDSFNWDNEMLGWLITQTAFMQPIVRTMVPSSRGYFLRHAANKWVQNHNKPEFCHYVMGHSHCPILTRIVIRELATHTCDGS